MGKSKTYRPFDVDWRSSAFFALTCSFVAISAASCSEPDLSPTIQGSSSCISDPSPVELTGVVSWSGGIGHGGVGWFALLDGPEPIYVDGFLSNVRESYVVRFVGEYDHVVKLHGQRLSRSIDVFGTWQGHVGMADASCAAVRRGGVDEAIVFEIGNGDGLEIVE